MKTIRTIIGTIGFIIAMLLAMKARAADAPSTAETIASEYREGEFNIESGYLARTEDFKEYEGSTYVGANYLVVQGAGLHIGATGSDDNQGNAVRTVEFGLLGRLPYKIVALELGLGAEFDLRPDKWGVYAEAGPRVRFFKKVDLFAKVRGVRPIEGSKGEHVAILAGGGLSF